MRIILATVAVFTLTSCGGGRVSGDIGRACMDAGRAAAKPALCSCIQQVANQSLSASDQRRAADFFSDPQKAQDTRTSSNASTEAFWLRYRAFSDRASASCR